MLTESAPLDRLPGKPPEILQAPEPMPDPINSAEQAAMEWLARCHSGRWSAADRRAHAAWLAADPGHMDEWRRAQALWSELGGLRPYAAADLRAAHRVRAESWQWRASFALAGLCALAIGLLPMLLPGSLEGTQTHQTARGEQRRLILADGSSVDLNTATRVEVDYGLRCRCLRLLSGEAVFRTAHGDPRGFVVNVGNGGVRDIGTEFWIRQQTTQTAVAVLEGAVEVSPRPGAAYTPLKTGDRLAFSGNGTLMDGPDAPLADLTAWMQGSIVFRDTPLPEVLAEFARYHSVNIEMDTQLRGYRLSGRFATTDLDGLLKLIQSAYPVSVQRLAQDRLRLEFRHS